MEFESEVCCKGSNVGVNVGGSLEDDVGCSTTIVWGVGEASGLCPPLLAKITAMKTPSSNNTLPTITKKGENEDFLSSGRGAGGCEGDGDGCGLGRGDGCGFFMS